MSWVLAACLFVAWVACVVMVLAILSINNMNEDEDTVTPYFKEHEIKTKGAEIGELVAKLRATEGLDQRWVSIGATDLQTGLMALTRGVAQPATF